MQNCRYVEQKNCCETTKTWMESVKIFCNDNTEGQSRKKRGEKNIKEGEMLLGCGEQEKMNNREQGWRVKLWKNDEAQKQTSVFQLLSKLHLQLELGSVFRGISSENLLLYHWRNQLCFPGGPEGAKMNGTISMSRKNRPQQSSFVLVSCLNQELAALFMPSTLSRFMRILI